MEKDVHHLREGKVVLYRRGNSSRYQFRIKDSDGKWIRRSAKSAHLEEAKEYAGNFFDEYRFSRKHNIPFLALKDKVKDFSEMVAEDFQKRLDANDGNPDTILHYWKILDNWIIPYFGKYRIKDVNTSTIEQFYEYMRDKLNKVPSKNTITNMHSVLNLVFKKAIAKKALDKKPLYPDKRYGEDTNKREWFTKQEYVYLLDKMDEWIDESKKIPQRKRQTEIRSLLKDYVLFLASTGCRTKEARFIKWKDFSYSTAWVIDQNTGKKKKEKYLLCTITHSKTKKGKGRQIVCRDAVEDKMIPNILSRFPYLQDLSINDLFKLDMYVFVRPSLPNKVPVHLHRIFRQFLSEYNLLYDTNGKERSLYSLRHSYISWGIIDKIDLYTLALQCGTSLKMIQEFYSSVEPIMKADVLSGRSRALK